MQENGSQLVLMFWKKGWMCGVEILDWPENG